ncbi:UNVERIFIED_CONTAM: hypothetical protein Slati_0102400 [Sesamum latifolium]|uniref:Reverse transcriptase zinc-binding domain-containing protein n=1 Tax=Sesamum latifolium TaxID=2727402 RepID=A0AAW2Y8L2_9LAMI
MLLWLLSLTRFHGDMSIIDALFDIQDRDCILGIPLGRIDQPDTPCWHFSQNGLFSVKSAYSITREINNPDSTTSHNRSHRSVYVSIWYADVPPKIRLFAWKLAQDALPIGQNLSKQLGNMKVACSFCGDSNESVSHTFIHCHFARQEPIKYGKFLNQSPSDFNLSIQLHHFIQGRNC